MTEHIKLLELFSGIQAQERSLRQIGVPYESVGVCDCDKDVLVSATAMRFDLEEEIANYDFPSVETMIAELQTKNIGYSFEKEKHTITSRTPINKIKQYYISDKLLNNLGDISKVERLPYADLVTYSSPCQSFSVAGKLGGAAKTCKVCGHKWDIDFSNPDYNYKCPICENTSLESTTSGLLSEVQRLLSVAYEHNELPKYLLLENVKNLVGKKFVPQFNAWIQWLNDLGYNTYYEVLNSKNYGIPQNRERIFALSIRKDIDNGQFKFPGRIPLNTRLKDMLEKNVDEKYYLPDERVEKILNNWATLNKKDDLPDAIRILGNYMPSGHDASRVVDIDGIAPTVKENHGTVTAIAEPFIVASRGRNPDNPSDRTIGAPTEQRLEPNFSGCTNTLTSVQKDNYVAEPIIYDDYNSRISSDQDAINTLTTNCGASAERNGVKILGPIVCEERRDEGIRFFKDDCVGTLRTIDACGDKRVLEPEPQLEFVGGLGDKDWAKDGKKLSRNYPQGSRVYSSDGIASALTAQGVGGAGGYSGLYAVEDKPDIIKEDVIFPVMVRKYEVDTEKLKKTLREHKNYSNKEIAEKLSVPLTQVEHWFRQDEYFAIPDSDVWFKLKNLLNIITDEFDESITTFEVKDGVYDKANRCYHIDGIAPTLTSTSSNEKIFEPNNIKWRIRKLTPKCCWRLMGFTDEDHDRAARYVSASALYKQAGNSICTCCLIAIFNALFLQDYSTSYADKLVDYNS